LWSALWLCVGCMCVSKSVRMRVCGIMSTANVPHKNAYTGAPICMHVPQRKHSLTPAVCMRAGLLLPCLSLAEPPASAQRLFVSAHVPDRRKAGGSRLLLLLLVVVVVVSRLERALAEAEAL